MTTPTWHTPPADLWASPDGWRAVVDLPGVSRDALTVSVEQQELSIEATDAAGRPWRRAWKLTDEVDGDAIAATLTDGVLTLDLPRREAVKPRRIAVH